MKSKKEFNALCRIIVRNLQTSIKGNCRLHLLGSSGSSGPHTHYSWLTHLGCGPSTPIFESSRFFNICFRILLPYILSAFSVHLCLCFRILLLSLIMCTFHMISSLLMCSLTV
jgi:hypothetical protein